jgi:hypothetical protein
MTSNIDQLKALCSQVIEYTNGEIWGYSGKFVVLTTYGYNENITIFYPSEAGWILINYTLPNEYEKAYNKLNEVILTLKIQQYNEKIERIKDDF